MCTETTLLYSKLGSVVVFLILIALCLNALSSYSLNLLTNACYDANSKGEALTNDPLARVIIPGLVC